MEKTILVSGSRISSDGELKRKLQKSTSVLINSDNSRIESILDRNDIDIILLEVAVDNGSDLNLIRNIKRRFPNTTIILINGNGNRNVIAKAFDLGANDAFRVPYIRRLIVERVNALIQEN